MTPALQEKYLRIEEHQWWCKARREFVLQLAASLVPQTTARILEIGCSGGVLLQQLVDCGYKDVHGIDVSEAAIGAARRRGLSNVAVMDASRLDCADGAFDLLIASDVLEHIARAEEALCEWLRVLAPAGKLIVFVPAFQALWSSHDEANQHFRRYSRPQLRAALEAAGFEIDRMSYWNALLTVPGVALKLAEKLSRRSSRQSETGGLVQPSRLINRLLYRFISMENSALRHINLPFGTSVFAIATAGPSNCREKA